MRITQWGEYGVHVSVAIARQDHSTAEPLGAAEIARQQNIALEYAQQILQRLRRGGIIDSVRGPQGGYHLAKPSTEITLMDILVAAEGTSFEVICESKPLNPERCASTTPCSLRPLWHELRDHVNQFLVQHTLDKLVNRFAIDDQPIQIKKRPSATTQRQL